MFPDVQAGARAAWLKVEEVARGDDRVVGLVLLGGRGKGLAMPWSDYDVEVLTRDGAEGDLLRELPIGVAGLDLEVCSVARYATLTTPWWHRYAFKDVSPVVDKLGGEVQRLVRRRAAYEAKLAETHAREWLSTYANQLYRAFKNDRDGLHLEARLDGAASVEPMIGALFAMHGRLRPYNKFLRWELEHDPLAALPWSGDGFLSLLARAVDEAGVEAYGGLFRGVLVVAERCGFGRHLRDEWGETVEWMITYGSSE